MPAPEHARSIIPDHPIWQALSSYIVGPADARLTFLARLARENGWSEAHAGRVFDEYRRFCFLAATSDDEQMTPSDAVDQAWHLHLSYTRDYWGRFCPEILGLSLHHGPTAGGEVERSRFFDQYARTLFRYEQVFGAVPPADIWPDAARRLIEDPRARRVHPREGVVVPRAALWVALILFCLFVALFLLVWFGRVFS